MTSSSPQRSSRKRKDHQFEEPPRRTYRKRTARINPDAIPQDQVDQLIGLDGENQDHSDDGGVNSRHDSWGTTSSYQRARNRMLVEEPEQGYMSPAVSKPSAPVAQMFGPNNNKDAAHHYESPHPGVSDMRPSNDIIAPSVPRDNPMVADNDNTAVFISSVMENRSSAYLLGTSSSRSPKGRTGTAIEKSTVTTQNSSVVQEDSVVQGATEVQTCPSNRSSATEHTKSFATSDSNAPTPDANKTLYTPSDVSIKQPRVSVVSPENTEILERQVRSPPIVVTRNGHTHVQLSPPHASLTTPPQPMQRQEATSRPRQDGHIPFWVITNEPCRIEELWEEGNLGSSLPDFIQALSQLTQRNDIEKIKLTLSTPALQTKITVSESVESSWGSAKEVFGKKLSAAVKSKGPAVLLGYTILVEPSFRETIPSSDASDDFIGEWNFG